MNRRLAHRPRYHSSTQQSVYPHLHMHRPYFLTRWSYRHWRPVNEWSSPGRSLAQIPLKHRLADQIMLYPV